MKIYIKILAFTSVMLLLACGGKEEKKEGFSIDRTKAEPQKTVVTETSGTKASERVTLDKKGWTHSFLDP